MQKNILTQLSDNEKRFFTSFFKDAPDSLVSSIIFCKFPKNHKLIHANDTCSHVYILLRERLQGIEESLSNEPYHFIEISPIEIIGDYELFIHETSRMITLSTMEPSCFLLLPANQYIQWIKKDSNALYIRTRMLIKQLLHQSQYERKLHFLNNYSKLLYLLYTEYEHKSSNRNNVKITYTRTELANKTGCSIRTINRLVNSFCTENLISLKGGKIHISYTQYEHIREIFLHHPDYDVFH